PQTLEEIEAWLEKLLAMDCDLTVDIEAFSLKHYDAGIGTISFAWSEHEGIAFAVDYKPIDHFHCCLGNDEQDAHTMDCSEHPGEEIVHYGEQVTNHAVRKLLLNFFLRFKKKAIYHNISYDAYNLIYQLFMRDLLDTQGLLEGMNVLLENWGDTQLITYLATNSCAGNDLQLKSNAQEFAGDWAEDVKDITKIPLDRLLRYNLVDTLSTWFLYKKNYPKMVLDQQLDIYKGLFKPSIRDIIQMQLTGMPLYMQRVEEVASILEAEEAAALKTIESSSLIKEFTHRLNEKWVAARNAKLKKKRVTLDDAQEKFNPSSGPQLQQLLYEMLELPVLDLTDSKQPSTGGDTLKKLLNHTENQDI